MKTVQEWVRQLAGSSPSSVSVEPRAFEPQPLPSVPTTPDISVPAPQGNRHQGDRNRRNFPPNGNPNQRQQGQRGGKPQPHAPQNQGPRKGGLRVYPLGGFEQVGRNCFAIDVDGDLYIIDLGLQFPDEDMLGIDYLVPDLSSLRGQEARIKAVIFTHGHLDHIGAVQHVLPQIHFPPCYGTRLTMAFVKKRLEEEHLTSKARLNTVNFGQRVRIGKVEIEFMRVSHSIPDSAAVAVHTPHGTIVHTGDFKFDMTPVNEAPADFQRLAELGSKGVLAIIADSTNALKPGFSKSEREISLTLRDLIREAPGRIIISTFSSLLNRLAQVCEHARETNRKVYVAGRSMEANLEIAQQLGYIKVPRGMIRKAGPGMDKLPDSEVLILTTGSQGEEVAGLARMGLGTHRHIAIKRGDTVVLSSNPILGNERAVAKVVNNLNLKGAIVKTNQELALHVTGHGHQQDILLMHRLVRAKHVIPEHGEPHMKSAHGELARQLGYQDNQIHLLENGEILEFDKQGAARKSKQKFPYHDVIIDGRGSAGEGQRTLTDRRIMSDSGVVIVAFRCYTESKRLLGEPDVITRGFLYGSEQQEITTEIIQIAKKAYEDELNRGTKERKEFKRSIQGALYRYFDRKLDREPMVIPIMMDV